MVGADSGLVISAGSVTWGGRGGYWVRTTWKDPSAILCSQTVQAPTDLYLDTAFCDWMENLVNSPTAREALDVAIHTNLALDYTQRGPVSAFVYLYTPTVGGCDPSVAEWLVVLTRK